MNNNRKYEKIIVTGGKGFIGKHLVKKLFDLGHAVVVYDKDDSISALYDSLKDTDFIFHLAGVNRPQRVEEFSEGNVDLTKLILKTLTNLNRSPAILFSSSIQAELENDYGRSKKAAEELCAEYIGKMYVYRLPNVFGPNCLPNYNSAIATFCHNLNHQLPIQVDDESKMLRIVYVEDVVNSFIRHLSDESASAVVTPEYQITLGELVKTLRSLNNENDLVKKLSKTFFSYYC